MVRCVFNMRFGVILSCSLLASLAGAQSTSPQNVVSDAPGPSASGSPTSGSSASGSAASGPTASAAPATNTAVQPVQIQLLANDSDTSIDPASLLPDLPPVPRTKASLIGGTVQRLDRVRDQITVQVFGGGKMTIFYDPRTHIDRGADEGTTADLHKGDRVYIDTILDGSNVFAKTIRVKVAASAGGESQGTVTSYRADKGELMLRDVLSPQPLKIRLTPQTQILQDGHAASASELAAGTLVAVKFGSQQDGHDVAREVTVLAVPGASFTFAGRVSALDLRLGLLVLTSSTDGKSYEVYLDPSAANDNLHPDSDVTVLARFEGNRYVARSVTINSRNDQ